jgi:hypothetical protein
MNMYILRCETITADRRSSLRRTSFQKRQMLRKLAGWREGADGEMELTVKRESSWCGLVDSGVVHLNLLEYCSRVVRSGAASWGASVGGPQAGSEGLTKKAEGPTASN